MTEIADALRSIRRSPQFAVATALTFAIGVGLNVAVFAAVDRVLFRSLPFPHPDELAVMTVYRGGSLERDTMIGAKYVDRLRELPGILSITAAASSSIGLRVAEETDGAQTYDMVPVQYSTLTTLGIAPAVGADFSESDARAERRLVIISHEMWRQTFGGRTDIIGQAMWSSAGRYEVSGVLPADFLIPQVRVTGRTSGILLNGLPNSPLPLTASVSLPIIRLKPGVSIAQLQAQVDAITADLGPQFPAREGRPASVMRIEPLREVLFGKFTAYLVLVTAAAILVLLVACLNLTSLLLVRARLREHRAAVQLALGASRGRLVRSALAEAFMLSSAGCAVALVAVQLSSGVLHLWLPPIFSSYLTSAFDARVLLVAFGLATMTALAASIAPALRASRGDLIAELQRGLGRAGAARLRGSNVIIAVEIALSMVLVVGATMLGRTLLNVESTDVGFRPDDLVTVGIVKPTSTNNVDLLRKYRDALETLRDIPGVRAASAADTLPMVGILNRPIAGIPGVQRVPMMDGLVETLGMQILAGRPISIDEVRAIAPVAILSRDALARLWPGVSPQEAIGRVVNATDEPPRQIVGVVSDVHPWYLAQAFPSLYVPIDTTGLNNVGVLFAARVSSGHALTVAELTRRLAERGVRPKSVVIEPVNDTFATSVINQRFRARLFSAFGVVSLLLAVLGIFAVQSFAVAQRRTEFGIRVSLGAGPRHLSRMVVYDTLRPVATGIAIGGIVSYWASQFVTSFLYGVDAHDGWTLVLASALLTVAAVAGVWSPARRAARTDPALVFRTQ